MPLAARMRPRLFEQIVGQTNILRPGSPLHQLAQPSDPKSRSALASVVLFGPPGTGKTTIAQAIANSSGRRFVELSAINAGVKDVREVIERARSDFEIYGRQTVLFLDEIHRFSKSQQDSLLPAVENGVITLIAATTENPSFSVIAPLLSRSLLVELEALSEQDLFELLKRAVKAPEGLAGRVTLSKEAADSITRLAGGDARKALTILEASALAVIDGASANGVEISTSTIELATDRAFVAYDKTGDQHYDIISAFIKSIRGSDADAAVHYLARMLEGGEDPRFIARRLIILASEDVGLADLHATTIAVDAFNAVNLVGMPEGRIPLANATVYLALAPKSNAAYNAINSALDDVRAGFISKIPKALRSSNYPGAKQRGNGSGYKYPHDDIRGIVEQQYLSEPIDERRYYVPKTIGAEREIKERWSRLRDIIRSLKK
jgi:putative ATPase